MTLSLKMLKLKKNQIYYFFIILKILRYLLKKLKEKRKKNNITEFKNESLEKGLF